MTTTIDTAEQTPSATNRAGAWKPSHTDRAYYTATADTPSSDTRPFCAMKSPGDPGDNPAWDDVATADETQVQMAMYACNRCPLLDSCRETALSPAFSDYTGVMGGSIPAAEQKKQRANLRREKRDAAKAAANRAA